MTYCFARELTIKDKAAAQAELAATIVEKEDLKKQVDVRIAQLLKVKILHWHWQEGGSPAAETNTMRPAVCLLAAVVQPPVGCTPAGNQLYGFGLAFACSDCLVANDQAACLPCRRKTLPRTRWHCSTFCSRR